MGARILIRGILVAARICLTTASVAAVLLAAEVPPRVDAYFPKDMQTGFIVRFDKPLSAGAARELRFDVDREGRPFLLVTNTLVALKEKPDDVGGVYKVPGVRRVDDFSWTPAGELLFSADGMLGGLTEAGFGRIQKLPAAGMKIEPASNDLWYLYGGSGYFAERDIYLYRRGGEVLRLLRAESPVRAVVGSGETTFFAVGRGIFLHVPGKTLRAVYTADEEVTALALAPPSGLFFATAKRAGYVRRPGSGFTFMRGVGVRLRVRGDALYLFNPERGVMKCTPVSRFEQMAVAVAKARQAARARAKTAQGFLARGRAAAKRNQWDDAVAQFTRAREHTPTDPEVLYSLALAHDRAGGRELVAIFCYEAALAAGHANPNPYYLRLRIGQLRSRVEANARKLRQEALTHAGRLSWGDPHGSAGGTVVGAQIDARNYAGARKTIETMSEHRRGLEYYRIARAQIDAGDLGGARATINLMDTRDWALATLAAAQAKRGDVGGARRTMGEMKTTAHTDDVVKHIALSSAKVGNRDAAAGELRTIDDAAKRSRATAWVARELAAAKRLKTALATAANVTDPLLRRKTYVHIARKQAVEGDATGAAKTIALAGGTDAADPGLCVDLVYALAELKDLEAAAKVAAKIPVEDYRCFFTRGFIADRLIQAGETEAARGAVAELLTIAEKSKESLRDARLRYVSALQARRGDFDAARETLARIQKKAGRRAALVALLEAQGEIRLAQIHSWSNEALGLEEAREANLAAVDLPEFIRRQRARDQHAACATFIRMSQMFERMLSSIKHKQVYWQRRRKAWP